MKRRDFITLLGSAAVAWPLTARAQQAGMPIVGFLSGRSPGESTYLVASFQQGLGETGHIVGQNVAIEFRWAEGDLARMAALAAELIERRVAVIATVTVPTSGIHGRNVLPYASQHV